MSCNIDRSLPPRGGAPFFILLFLFFSVPLPAVAQAEPPIPHVNAEARESFISYRYAIDHKAYAIAPGGAWSWISGAANRDEAGEKAIAACEQNTQHKCMLYALDNQLVFDEQRWATLWGPYPSKAEALAREVGTQVGKRFPDLRFRDAKGRQYALGDYRGNVTFVHFWGSWCPPCMREFPSLLKLSEQLQRESQGRVAMVLLQVREPYATATQWAEKNGYHALPLFDSGHQTSEDHQLNLADGTTIEDRALAGSFPSSYVLDKNGVILFKHRGPVRDWGEYLPFFRDAMAAKNE